MNQNALGQNTLANFVRYLPLSEEDRVNSGIFVSKQQMICSNFRFSDTHMDWTYRR